MIAWLIACLAERMDVEILRTGTKGTCVGGYGIVFEGLAKAFSGWVTPTTTTTLGACIMTGSKYVGMSCVDWWLFFFRVCKSGAGVGR